MDEEFDDGKRRGLYLKPMLRTANGSRAGGELVTLACAGESAAFRALDSILRETPAAVFTPPIFASDAMEGANPLFAVHVLREFVWICLAQSRRWSKWV